MLSDGESPSDSFSISLKLKDMIDGILLRQAVDKTMLR